MDSSPAAKNSAIRPCIQRQMDERVLSTPEDRVKKKLFDLDDDAEDVELNQWSSSSEYFSQSSRENSCSISEGFSQSNLFDDSPSTKVCATVLCVCVCVCVCVGVCVCVRFFSTYNFNRAKRWKLPPPPSSLVCFSLIGHGKREKSGLVCIITPCACTRGKVFVVVTKIARSGRLGICEDHKHNE